MPVLSISHGVFGKKKSQMYLTPSARVHDNFRDFLGGGGLFPESFAGRPLLRFSTNFRSDSLMKLSRPIFWDGSCPSMIICRTRPVVTPSRSATCWVVSKPFMEAFLTRKQKKYQKWA